MAAATTYLSERTRTTIGARSGIPDPLLGLAEDALALSVAVLVTRRRDEPTAQGPIEELNSTADAPRRSPIVTAARGLAAGAVGTAAMISVRVAYLRALGG